MPSSRVSPQATVGRLAAEHPLSTRVFARHGIDFCCGGGRALGEVCLERGLDPVAVVAEIEELLAGPRAAETSWDDVPLAEVVRHVLDAFHAPHREELPRLEAMARKVHAVHGAKDPARLAELWRIVATLRRELEDHMAKEERVLFPLIAAGRGATAARPIAVMEAEHEVAGALLRRIRELTDDFRVPEGACNTWRALWAGLETFERDLHEHVHLENNVLFPRAPSTERVR
jgi:regulator of cell morphogenesis and NO signaling